MPAKSRLAVFVRALAEMMPDATNAAMVLEEDAKEEATIRETVAEYFGGKIADDTDASDAMAEAVAVLEGKADPSANLKAGKLGALICGLVEERKRALITLHQIYARAKNLGGTPADPLPGDIRPIDVLVEVDEALIVARGWTQQRGVA